MVYLDYFGREILTLCTLTFFVGVIVGACFQHWIERKHDY